MGGLAHSVRVLLLRGSKFYCPLCNRGYRRFLPGGFAHRPNARCPGCNSLERHRLLAALLDKLAVGGGLEITRRALHVAPENALVGLFSHGTD